KLALFVPFANRDYTNVWSEFLHVTPGYASLTEYYKEKRKFQTRPERIISDTRQWWSNGALICNEESVQQQVWGDSMIPALLDMLLAVCRNRLLPNVEFCINKRDHPQFKLNQTDANDHS